MLCSSTSSIGSMAAMSVLMSMSSIIFYSLQILLWPWREHRPCLKRPTPSTTAASALARHSSSLAQAYCPFSQGMKPCAGCHLISQALSNSYPRPWRSPDPWRSSRQMVICPLYAATLVSSYGTFFKITYIESTARGSLRISSCGNFRLAPYSLRRISKCVISNRETFQPKYQAQSQ